MKGTCDRIITYDKDVSHFYQFAAVMQKEIRGIQIVSVDVRNEKLKNEVRNTISLKGSMKVHQIVWSQNNNNQLLFSTLSCFTYYPLRCQHYHLQNILYESAPEDSSSVSDIDTCDEDLKNSKPINYKPAAFSLQILRRMIYQ